MEHFVSVFIISVLFVLNVQESLQLNEAADELENHIKPEDLQELEKLHNLTTENTNTMGPTTNLPESDCFGLGPFGQLMKIFMNPDSSKTINTHFYFSSRKTRTRVQVYPGQKFGLKGTDFKPQRKTVMIVHGFMSHSDASWVHDMTQAFLIWGDVNVIAVDWSGGGSTWKYWKAVANAQIAGSVIVDFMRQLIKQTGASIKNMHFVGHSLGAHIASQVSYNLGKVARITGLDPAQPCFRSNKSTERIDSTDADYVDIIHTNGRHYLYFGLGLPDPIEVDKAICNHGRAYLLFTESLINNNCTFIGHKWDLTYEGANASIKATCDRKERCPVMGISADGSNGVPKAHGSYFVLTTDKEPFCPTEWERHQPQPNLLRDLKNFDLDKLNKKGTSTAPPMAKDVSAGKNTPTTVKPTNKKKGRIG